MRIVKVPGVATGRRALDYSVAVWVTMLVLLCIVAMLHDSLLPPKFLADQAEIASRLRAVIHFRAFGDSFDNLAWVFFQFGLGTTAISLIGVLASTVGSLIAIWRSGVVSLKPVEFVLIAFWLVNQTVYIGLPSKEIVISLMTLAIFLASNTRLTIPVFIVSASLVTVYFRSYWVITLVGTCLLYSAPTFMRRPFSLVVVALGMFVSVAILFAVMYGQTLDFARDSSNQWRDPSEVSTIIEPFFQGGGVMTGVINVTLTWITLFVPFKLLVSGSPLQFLGGLGICLTFFTLLTRYRTFAALFPISRFERLCFCLTFCFVATQALFEPDYGSYLRHLSPVAPVILYLIGRLRVLQEDRLAKMAQPDPEWEVVDDPVYASGSSSTPAAIREARNAAQSRR